MREQEREVSKRQMWASYEGMMNTYAQQQKMLAKRPAWVAPKTHGAEEPLELTVTHVNHTQDLLVNVQYYKIVELCGQCDWNHAHS